MSETSLDKLIKINSGVVNTSDVTENVMPAPPSPDDEEGIVGFGENWINFNNGIFRS